MPRIFTICTFTLLLAGACPAAVADGLFVACHAGVTLTPTDVRDVFLGEMQFINALTLMYSWQPALFSRSDEFCCVYHFRSRSPCYSTTKATQTFVFPFNT